MQRNKKALLIYFSIVGGFILLLLILILINIKSFDIKFFHKIYTDKKTIRIQEPQEFLLL